MTGTIYAAKAAVSMSGNALLNDQGSISEFIAADLNLSGNANLSVQLPTTSLQRGQTAGVSFWNGKGQNVIKSLNGGATATATALGNWLAGNFASLFGEPGRRYKHGRLRKRSPARRTRRISRRWPWR